MNELEKIRMSIPRICPLLAAACHEDGCAWWDRLAGSCCMASGADGIREAR